LPNNLSQNIKMTQKKTEKSFRVRDNKRQLFKYFLAGLFLVFIFLARGVGASVIDDLRLKIDDRNSKIEVIEKEIEAFQKELSKVQAEKSSLENTIKALDISRNKFLSGIKLTESKIEATNLEIQKLSLEIGGKQSLIEQNTVALAGAIRKVQQLSSDSLVESMLLYDSVSELWNYLDRLEQFQKSLKESIDTLRELKTALTSNKLAIEESKKKLLSYKKDLSDQKQIVENNKAEKAALLSATKNRETTYQTLIRQKEENKAQFERELFELESQIQFELDPSRIPPSGKGILSWPLDSVYITQKFGKTIDAKRLYTSGTHSGVDFRASVGTPVKSVLSGKVRATGDTDRACDNASYGKWVLIDHANGLSSLYAHFDIISVSPGQDVITGQRIGYSGNTGYSTGPHLHLTIFAQDGVEVGTLASRACRGAVYTIPLANPAAYLDPLEYL